MKLFSSNPDKLFDTNTAFIVLFVLGVLLGIFLDRVCSTPAYGYTSEYTQAAQCADYGELASEVTPAEIARDKRDGWTPHICDATGHYVSGWYGSNSND